VEEGFEERRGSWVKVECGIDGGGREEKKA
jgi:hypothetical protein